MEEERAFARRCLATDGREILSVRLGQSFTYDGYGNLLQKTVTQGSAPMLSVAVDPATNRIVGQSYDANGNLLVQSATYDVLNRLATYYSSPSGSTESYVYGPDNERVARKSVVNGGSTINEVYLYGVDGRRVGTYPWDYDTSGRLYFYGGHMRTLNLYFAGRVIHEDTGQPTVVDRVGSVRPLKVVNGEYTGGTGYYPYGEEQQPTANNTEKFATYFRDVTGLDYANQRYYSSQFGRFLTPDPSMGVDPANPVSWNKFAYVQNDPINLVDPKGWMASPYFCAAELSYEECFGSNMLSAGGNEVGRGGGFYCDQGLLPFVSTPAACNLYIGAVVGAAAAAVTPARIPRLVVRDDCYWEKGTGYFSG